MKLLVPYFEKLQAVDSRLIRLAEFLGISCELLPLTRPAGSPLEYLEQAVPDQPLCLVVNPEVLQAWVGGDGIPADLISFLASHFPYLLVHAPRPAPFDSSVIAGFSGNKLRTVQAVEHSVPYEISPDARDVCHAFAGLSFGSSNFANDRVFSIGSEVPALRTLISLGGLPFMAALKREKTEILFLAGQDVADLDADAGDTPLLEYFSRLLPHAMALRYIFGEEAWHPSAQHAAVIIDDPLLQRNYGFLNFERLLELMNRDNFHTTIAFIPHNFRRSSPRITKTFRENPARLALCYHGNDHTGAEFASTDPILLNTMLQIAEQRMNLHHEQTGVDCDRVMVFPQGNFSAEAMSALKFFNFDGAVNSTPHPAQQRVRFTLGEMAQPALLRYDGFPLFLRRYSLQTQSADIAFDLFFGKPVLIVEHHDVFQHPEALLEAVQRVNAVAPGIQWSNLSTAIAAATLIRRAPDAYYVWAFSRTVRVSNQSASSQRFQVAWKHCGQGSEVEQVLMDGMLCEFETGDFGTLVSMDLAAGSSHTLSVVHRNGRPTLRSLGFRRNTRAFLRRRLSELRDNYLSKNPVVLSLAKSMRNVLSKTPAS